MQKNNTLLRVLMAMALVLVIIGTTAGCFGGGDKILVDQESYTWKPVPSIMAFIIRWI